jgi:phospholipase/carboxylesterase
MDSAGMPEAPALEHRLRPVAGEPAGALVLFHGRGTSEHDLFPLLDALDPESALAGVTPRGPLTLPPGGAHWYVVARVGYPDPGTFHATFERATRFVDGLPERLGVPPGRTVLGGFSQGAVMAYALGLGQGQPRPAGILAMSGFVPVVDGFEIDPANAEALPVAITHGTLDPIISVAFGRDARDRLTAMGADVTYREARVDHTVDPAWLPELSAWVRQRVETTA